MIRHSFNSFFKDVPKEQQKLFLDFQENHPYSKVLFQNQELQYISSGDGEKALVFLHGALVEPDMWFYPILELEKSYRIIASYFPPDMMSLADTTDFILAILQQEQVTNAIFGRTRHKVESNLGLLGTVFSHVAFRSPYKLSKAYIIDKELWVNDKCNSCGICVNICPVGNIKLSQSESPTPIWQHNCVNCLACYHHCPEDAIQLGEKPQMEIYRHPEIELEEIIAAS